VLWGCRDGTVVGALTSHQCGLGSISRLGVRCGLSLLLVLFLAPRGFSVGTPVLSSPQKPTLLNSNSIWTQWSKSHPVDVPLFIPIYLLYIYHYMTDYKFLFNTGGGVPPNYQRPGDLGSWVWFLSAAFAGLSQFKIYWRIKFPLARDN